MAVADDLRETLRGALDRMIPADDDPGALDLDCDRFVLELLDSDAELAAFYENGLRNLHAEGFDSLPPDEKDRLLSELESCSSRDGWAVSPSAFVEAMAQHAMEGFYTHPKGWQTVGFEVTL
ncbi:MAG: hypothetical protein BGO01_00630 [Armatimonadetes bacterium 55-13]|nr:gluconate 2-dehydrogenase subunit 3 family protein [Armatimonadota bacterium]OJU62104.1 MAG: hypothetical protein BGO01_00630 [Armatimonadetes bacterium 55-13]